MQYPLDFNFSYHIDCSENSLNFVYHMFFLTREEISICTVAKPRRDKRGQLPPLTFFLKNINILV